jgi:hypothetical protein
MYLPNVAGGSQLNMTFNGTGNCRSHQSWNSTAQVYRAKKSDSILEDSAYFLMIMFGVIFGLGIASFFVIMRCCGPHKSSSNSDSTNDTSPSCGAFSNVERTRTSTRASTRTRTSTLSARTPTGRERNTTNSPTLARSPAVHHPRSAGSGMTHSQSNTDSLIRPLEQSARERNSSNQRSITITPTFNFRSTRRPRPTVVVSSPSHPLEDTTAPSRPQPTSIQTNPGTTAPLPFPPFHTLHS